MASQITSRSQFERPKPNIKSRLTAIASTGRTGTSGVHATGSRSARAGDCGQPALDVRLGPFELAPAGDLAGHWPGDLLQPPAARAGILNAGVMSQATPFCRRNAE